MNSSFNSLTARPTAKEQSPTGKPMIKAVGPSFPKSDHSFTPPSGIVAQ